MPVKRRASKQRLTNAALLEIWRGTFECGCDFFGNLEPLGIIEPHNVWPLEDREKARAAFMAAAREAWGQLGAAFLADWRPPHAGDKPWALVQFGEPGACL